MLLTPVMYLNMRCRFAVARRTRASLPCLLVVSLSGWILARLARTKGQAARAWG